MASLLPNKTISVRPATKPPTCCPILPVNHTSSKLRCNAAASMSMPDNNELARIQLGMDKEAFEAAKSTPIQSSAQPAGLWGSLKSFVLGGNDKLDKQRLAELGFGAFASYGVISNLNATILLTLAWLSVVKTQGVTPLAAGMWPKFLAAYGALWISSHFMRPIRISLAIAVAPAFQGALEAIQRKTGLNKVVSFGIMLVGVALFAISTLFLSLLVCGGFPQGLPAFLASLAGQR